MNLHTSLLLLLFVNIAELQIKQFELQKYY